MSTTTEIKQYMAERGMPDWAIRKAVGLLPIVRRRLKQNKIYIEVNSVARSGLSRYISVFIVDARGAIICLDRFFGVIYSNATWPAITATNRGVLMRGCGMDMLFRANYKLFITLLPRTAYQGYTRYKRLR